MVSKIAYVAGASAVAGAALAILVVFSLSNGSSPLGQLTAPSVGGGEGLLTGEPGTTLPPPEGVLTQLPSGGEIENLPWDPSWADPPDPDSFTGYAASPCTDVSLNILKQSTEGEGAAPAGLFGPSFLRYWSALPNAYGVPHPWPIHSVALPLPIPTYPQFFLRNRGAIISPCVFPADRVTLQFRWIWDVQKVVRLPSGELSYGEAQPGDDLRALLAGHQYEHLKVVLSTEGERDRRAESEFGQGQVRIEFLSGGDGNGEVKVVTAAADGTQLVAGDVALPRRVPHDIIIVRERIPTGPSVAEVVTITVDGRVLPPISISPWVAGHGTKAFIYTRNATGHGGRTFSYWSALSNMVLTPIIL